MNIEMIIYTFNFILAFILGIENITYFIIVRNIWRWIKLMYALNCFVVAYMLFSFIFFDQAPPTALHTGVVTMLLITLQGGTIVSFAKLKAGGSDIKKEIKFALLRKDE